MRSLDWTIIIMKLTFRQTAICTAFLLTGAASAWAQGDAKDLYLNKCATCHGPDGAGKTAMGKKLKIKDVHEAAGKISTDEMIKIVTNGKGQDMDSYSKQFTKDQIKGLVDYYRSLAK
jgi:mono/diheme cytochrome c family protein